MAPLSRGYFFARMTFVLHISAAPESFAAEAAFRYAKALREESGQLYAVYFSGAAARTFQNPSHSLYQSWQAFFTGSERKGYCCFAAVENHFTSRKLPGFIEIAGLGQLIELSSATHQVISFGNRLAS
jgi:sulfur relay (sulfurtransferase) complex TusBCD TusD component (DsrE family)